MMRRTSMRVCAFVAAWTCIFSGAACKTAYVPKPLSDKSVSLTAALTADRSVRTGKAGDFAAINTQFCTELFKRAFSMEKNTLVSPLSAAAVLAMIASGAKGETLAQTEKVLGASLSELNPVLSAYLESLGGFSDEKLTLSIADSLWIKDSYAPYMDGGFLQTCENYYDAEIYSSPFDHNTLSDINQWTKNQTRGMIGKILDEIGEGDFLYLINALYFSGEWLKKYEKSDVSTKEFTCADGAKVSVRMMDSEENGYLSDENTRGFIKPYLGGRFAFAALLPDENLTIEEYAATMSAAKWENLFSAGKRAENVNCRLPAFSYDFDLNMGGLLAQMGMTDAFSPELADFTGMLPSSPDSGNAYLGFVKQKTRIEVDEAGTKASAVTIGGMRGSCSPDPLTVILDRPFVYAIVDTQTNYPLFLGAVTKL